MRKRIVIKLFVLTTALCMLILATIFIGQTIFFKQYYANRKVDDLTASINSFEQAYLTKAKNGQTSRKLEQDFYREHNAWITTLDPNGNLKNSDDYYLEVQLDRSDDKTFSNTNITIPLYNLIDVEDIEYDEAPFSSDMRMSIYGVRRDDVLVPYVLGIVGTFAKSGTLGWLDPDQLEAEKEDSFWENKQLAKKVTQFLANKKPSQERASFPVKEEQNPRLTIEPQSPGKPPFPVTMVNGTVTKVVLPDVSEPLHFIYSNHLFMERIRAFQANLLLNENYKPFNSLQVLDYVQNDVKYKLFIKPTKDQNGETTYIFAMASLQPVDEAVQMVKDYYVYIIAFVLLLIILASFYYSKKIASPLLRINRTTKQIAGLDFTERIPITSKDEIGDLSHNINVLSHTLHSHIEQLQQDIAKEKQLENTRKEFISGVSHELKTPLSIMKSCLSILRDGVASHKKDYYFEAMEKEVDKMDLLIVDMLELAKFESGTYQMKMDAFYIDEVIERTCNQLSLEIAEKRLNIHTQLDPIEVVANQHRIEQVITNFMTNAIRHTPEEKDIILSTIADGEKVKVCVENKGTHIEKEQLDKIWDRFYRGDASRKRTSGGTGLGLAISKNILELHDVEYGACNTEDGVLFFFYLNKNV